MKERIDIEIRSMSELPLAYEKAITKFQEEYYEDCWNGTIELKKIKFQSNFRREEYIAVFVVSEGE